MGESMASDADLSNLDESDKEQPRRKAAGAMQPLA